MAVVTAFHLIEHLPLSALLEFLNEAFRVLVPGGPIILETPNPQNLLVGACNFYVDATHVKPLHPAAMEFILQKPGLSACGAPFPAPLSRHVPLGGGFRIGPQAQRSIIRAPGFRRGGVQAMTRVAICTPDVTSGDAVSNDVLGMHAAFERWGFETAVFGSNAFIMQPKVHPIEQMPRYLARPEDLLVYHHSVGWDAGLQVFKSAACRKVIKYHNVTPPSFFVGVGDHYLVACASGRNQLQDIGTLPIDLYLGRLAVQSRRIGASWFSKDPSCGGATLSPHRSAAGARSRQADPGNLPRRQGQHPDGGADRAEQGV